MISYRGPFGRVLPLEAPPPSLPVPDRPPSSAFAPYKSRVQFEIADLIYRRVQMSGKNIDHLFQLWAATTGDNPPFSDKEDLYTIIDATTAGNVPPWQCFSISMDVDADDDTVPSWKTAEYDVYFRDPKVMLESQLANPDFHNKMDLSPK